MAVGLGGWGGAWTWAWTEVNLRWERKWEAGLLAVLGRWNAGAVRAGAMGVGACACVPADLLRHSEECFSPRTQLLQRGGTRAAAQPAALAAALAVAREGGSVPVVKVAGFGRKNRGAGGGGWGKGWV